MRQPASFFCPSSYQVNGGQTAVDVRTPAATASTKFHTLEDTSLRIGGYGQIAKFLDLSTGLLAVSSDSPAPIVVGGVLRKVHWDERTRFQACQAVSDGSPPPPPPPEDNFDMKI